MIFNDYDPSNYNNIPTLIRAAEEMADWKMYILAIPSYSHVIQSLPSVNISLKINLTLRKAQLYLLTGEPQKTIETLEGLALGSGDPERIYNRNRQDCSQSCYGYQGQVPASTGDRNQARSFSVIVAVYRSAQTEISHSFR